MNIDIQIERWPIERLAPGNRRLSACRYRCGLAASGGLSAALVGRRAGLIRNVTRRLERLEARAKEVAAVREPHVICFIGPLNKRLTARLRGRTASRCGHTSIRHGSGRNSSRWCSGSRSETTYRYIGTYRSASSVGSGCLNRVQ